MKKILLGIMVLLLCLQLPANTKTLSASIEKGWTVDTARHNDFIDLSWASPEDPNWREHSWYIVYNIDTKTEERNKYRAPKPLKDRQITVYFYRHADGRPSFDCKWGYEVKFKNDNKSFLYTITGKLDGIIFLTEPSVIYSYPAGKPNGDSSSRTAEILTNAPKIVLN